MSRRSAISPRGEPAAPVSFPGPALVGRRAARQRTTREMAGSGQFFRVSILWPLFVINPRASYSLAAR